MPACRYPARLLPKHELFPFQMNYAPCYGPFAAFLGCIYIMVRKTTKPLSESSFKRKWTSLMLECGTAKVKPSSAKKKRLDRLKESSVKLENVFSIKVANKLPGEKSNDIK